MAAALVAASATAGRAQAPPPTSPTTPAGTTPTCAVSGPRLDDRRAALRTGLPAKQTIIALTKEQRQVLTRRLPAAVSRQLDEVGAMFAPVDDDGTVSVKSLWRKDLRRATGRLRVSGKRLDAPGGQFFADLSPAYARKRAANFVPGSLNFTALGCWQITARAGKARVTYVALVRAPERGEFAPYLP